MSIGLPPVPPAFGINRHRGDDSNQAFIARWKSGAANFNQAVGIFASTKLPAVQSGTAQITVFQAVGNLEVQVGAPINARINNGVIEATWQTTVNLKQGAYHFKVSARVLGNNYTGKTTTPLIVGSTPVDSFGTRIDYRKLGGGY